MLRAAMWTLRQRRYAALAVLLAVIGLGCIAMGTFELHRFHEKVADNNALKRNAHAAATTLDTGLVPLTGSDVRAPDSLAIRFRTVDVTGTYSAGRQYYLADQTQGNDSGYYVVTPLHTAQGDLLVVRGFVAAAGATDLPGRVAAPPTGTVSVRGRLQTAQTGDDKLARNGHDLISTVNPAQQAKRSGVATYAAYLTLDRGTPGTAGVRALPAIDLSNPSGGAGELQLFSYILQWYVFALLAFLGPFLMSRSEIREAQREYLGIDPSRIQFDELEPEPERAALAAGSDGGGGGAQLVVRGRGSVARIDDIPVEVRQRAARLADRYGKSLGPGFADKGDLTPRPRPVAPRAAAAPGLAEPHAPRRSAEVPHRAIDDVHGAYNDYLWQLALSDGEVLEPPATQDEDEDRD